MNNVAGAPLENRMPWADGVRCFTALGIQQAMMIFTFPLFR